MRAVICKKYGSPELLDIKEVVKPTPKSNEVLIKIHAATLNRTDNATLHGIPFFARLITGVFRPKKEILGSEFAGEIEAIGENISMFKVGDRVFGFNEDGFGSHAQYQTIDENKALAVIPDGISYEEAAPSNEGAFYAYNFINKVDLKKGDKVLINGATGAIGSAAVQFLKYLDADVTAVCATQNIELVRSLGANRVIDYLKEDFTHDDDRYDYVFDTVGKSSFFKCKKILKPGGVYISSDLGFMAQNMYLPLITPIIKPLMHGKITIFPFPTDCKEIILLVKKLIEEGKFKAVIDRTYTLEQIADAYNYVQKGQKVGNVVISISHDEQL